MPGDSGPETFRSSGKQGHEGGGVRFRVGVDHVRLHAAAAGGVAALGLFVRVRAAFECAVYLRAAADDEGEVVGESEVRILQSIPIGSQLYGSAFSLTDLNSPGNMLRNFPHLKAKDIITGTVNCVRKIPNDLYEELVHHME